MSGPNFGRWLGEVHELVMNCALLEDEMRKADSHNYMAAEVTMAKMQLQDCADDLRRIINGQPK